MSATGNVASTYLGQISKHELGLAIGAAEELEGFAITDTYGEGEYFNFPFKEKSIKVASGNIGLLLQSPEGVNPGIFWDKFLELKRKKEGGISSSVEAEQ